MIQTKNGPMNEADLDVQVVTKKTPVGEHVATEYRDKTTGELVKRDLSVRIFQEGAPQ